MAVNSRVYILKYNTYFDRVYKREETVSAYSQYLLYDKLNNPGIFNVDFKPKDGVSTTQIINWTGDEPNYLIVADMLNSDKILSRWFVMECRRTRQGQYELTLRRDVVADNIDAIANSTAYIEKAIASDDSPLIYNQEPISTNQIKTNEIQLKDGSKTAWLVGYVASDYDYTSGNSNKMTLTFPNIIPNFTTDTLENWSYYPYTTGKAYNRTDIKQQYSIYTITGIKRLVSKYTYTNNILTNTEEDMYSDIDKYFNKGFVPASKVAFDNYMKGRWNYWKGYIEEYGPLYETKQTVSKNQLINIVNLQGQILRVGTNNNYKYYRISVDQGIDSDVVQIEENKITVDGQGYLLSYLRSYFQNYPFPKDERSLDYPKNGANQNDMVLIFNYSTAKIYLTEITSDTATLDFPAHGSRTHLVDAPYDMFVIPYTDELTIQTNSANSYSPNKYQTLAISNEIAKTLDVACYDVQLLPYCPFENFTLSSNTLNIFDLGNNDYTLVKNSANKVVSVLYWCSKSSGTKKIVLENPLVIKNKKIENQCSFYRLVSPNYAGQFEFNLAKNNINNLDTFDVDYTYLPFNPYIHVNPDFSGLYGKDFNDCRGLICNGDFSIARTNDAWNNYQLQNKNYLAIFDRETQNLEINHKYDRISNITQAVAGTFQGMAGGMLASGGNPIAAGVGAGVSAAAGIADVAISEARYGESMKYRKDSFNMQLDNIKALPNSIAKTTAFTYNNKIFPILEYYTCTDEEKNITANLIANSGMTIESIGTLSDYLYREWSYDNTKARNFIKCRIIKLGNLSLDSHMQYTIFDELEKGVYFGGDL